MKYRQKDYRDYGFNEFLTKTPEAEAEARRIQAIRESVADLKDDLRDEVRNEVIKELTLNKRFIDYDNSRLIWRLTQPHPEVINFNSRSKKEDMKLFFDVIFRKWEDDAVAKDGWYIVTISRSEIRIAMRKRNIDATNYWIKSTRSNIANKKLKDYENEIVLSSYQKEIDGYTLKIKIPS